MKNSLLLLFCFFIFSCTKSDPDTPPDEPNPPVITDPGNPAGWNKISQSFSKPVYDISFITPAKGFMTTADSFYTSTDSGFSWKTIPNDNLQLYTIKFTDNLHGYSIGEKSYGYTFNGGDSWTWKKTNFTAVDVQFLTPENGFAPALEGFFSTNDAGISWTKVNTLSYPFLSVYMFDLQNGIAGTNDGKILKTINGGKDWALVKNTTPDYIHKVIFTDAINGWCTSGDSSLIKSTDSGNTWTIKRLPEKPFDLQFLSSGPGYLTATNYVYKSTDNGISWQQDLHVPLKRFVEIFFIDEKFGWVSTQQGDIYRYRKP